MPRAEETSHVPAGAYQKECPVCHIIFRTNDPRVIYHHIKCKKEAANRRYYQRNRDEIIEKVMERRSDPKEKSNEELETMFIKGIQEIAKCDPPRNPYDRSGDYWKWKNYLDPVRDELYKRGYKKKDINLLTLKAKGRR